MLLLLVVFNQGLFLLPIPGGFGQYLDKFLVVTPRGGAVAGTYGVEFRLDAKHLITHRKALPTGKDYLSQNVIGGLSEKPCSTSRQKKAFLYAGGESLCLPHKASFYHSLTIFVYQLY